MFIDRFDAILLDQGRTFMFELDRFGPEEDYHGAYAALGGSLLPPEMVSGVIRSALEILRGAYTEPASHTEVPTAAEAVGRADATLSADERTLLAGVIGAQETGTISDAHATTIRALAETHRLGIVSNVWGPSRHFEENLDRHGILDCFETRIWSSDHRRVKPDRGLFTLALDRLELGADRAVYVGDDPDRDVVPAKALGMGAVWIDHGDRTPPPVKPDLVLKDLADLPSA